MHLNGLLQNTVFEFPCVDVPKKLTIAKDESLDGSGGEEGPRVKRERIVGNRRILRGHRARCDLANKVRPAESEGREAIGEENVSATPNESKGHAPDVQKPDLTL